MLCAARHPTKTDQIMSIKLAKKAKYSPLFPLPFRERQAKTQRPLVLTRDVVLTRLSTG